jgi:hypothetical protein
MSENRKGTVLVAGTHLKHRFLKTWGSRKSDRHLKGLASKIKPGIVSFTKSGNKTTNILQCQTLYWYPVDTDSRRKRRSGLANPYVVVQICPKV